MNINEYNENKLSYNKNKINDNYYLDLKLKC